MSARRPGGPVLAIETSGRDGSVALAIGGEVRAQARLGEPRNHSAALVPAIEDLLARRRIEAARLAGIAVGAGPGSFTGVRVGAAAAKALASTLRIPLFPTSSLRAAALAGGVAAGQARPPARPARSRYVLFDARGGRLYAACYRVATGSVAELIAPRAATIVGVLNGRPWRNTLFMGSGAVAHADLLRAAGHALALPPRGVPDALSVIRACTWEQADPAAWEPDYLREWKPG